MKLYASHGIETACVRTHTKRCTDSSLGEGCADASHTGGFKLPFPCKWLFGQQDQQFPCSSHLQNIVATTGKHRGYGSPQCLAAWQQETFRVEHVEGRVVLDTLRHVLTACNLASFSLVRGLLPNPDL